MEMHHFGRPPYPSQIFPTLSVPLPSAHPSLHPSAHHGIQSGYHAATSIGPLEPRGCKLIIRQQPLEALVTQDGKEKTRKPVDPPPIVELSVDKHEDPQEQFLQNPYIFVCVKLIKAEREEAVHNSGDKALTGTLVSSLHRLKDINNKDGGFFVFGDISVRVQGSFRLHFSLYEFDKDRGQVQMLSTIISEKFRVLQPKDFKGMEESTYLSRAFSDQGVRLRLRKEPRGVMGNKRSYPFSESPNAPIRPNNAVEYGAQYQDTSSPNKKFKSDPEDRKDSFPIQPLQPQQPQQPQQPHPPPPVMFRRQASLATPYTMASYAPLPQTHYTMGSSAMQHPYSVGPSMGGTGMSGSSMSGSSMSGTSMSGSALYSNSPTYYNTNGAVSNVDQPNFYSQFPDTSYASQGGLGLQ